jgi:hypothetical protein
MTNAPTTVHNNAATLMRTMPATRPNAQGVEPPPTVFNAPRAERSLLLRHGFSLPPDERRSPEAARIWRQTLGYKPAAARDLTLKPNNF